MSDGRLRRNYDSKDSKLTIFAQILCDMITKDIVEFEKYGVSAADVTHLNDLNDEFKYFPTDVTLYFDYLSVIEERDIIIKDLLAIIKSMALRVELKWGKKSPKYRSLGIADLRQLTVEAFVARAGIIHSFMTENKTELETEGLTQAMLDNFESKIVELETKMNEAIEKENLRQEKTKERIILGNEVYKLVAKYCEIGKQIWNNVNPAKYKEYLIYRGIK